MKDGDISGLNVKSFSEPSRKKFGPRGTFGPTVRRRGTNSPIKLKREALLR